jgi:hypothetical protein
MCDVLIFSGEINYNYVTRFILKIKNFIKFYLDNNICESHTAKYSIFIYM